MASLTGILFQEFGIIAIVVIIGAFYLIPWVHKKLVIYRTESVNKIKENVDGGWKELENRIFGAQTDEFIGEMTPCKRLQECIEMARSGAEVIVYLEMQRAKPGIQWPEQATLQRNFSMGFDPDLIKDFADNSVDFRAFKYIEPANATSPHVNAVLVKLFIELENLPKEKTATKVDGDRTLVVIYLCASLLYSYLSQLGRTDPANYDLLNIDDIITRFVYCKHLVMDSILLAAHAKAKSGELGHWAYLLGIIREVRKRRSDLGGSCGSYCYLEVQNADTSNASD